jgi:sec-independent protein translocase protein TatB
MFDIGFSELLLIGVVALVVIGPERMPKVARTAGHLFGRFQRYVSNVKADINREMDLEDLRKVGQTFKASVEQAAQGVESSAKEAEFTMRDEVISPTEKVLKSMTDMEKHHPVLTPEVEKLLSGPESVQDALGGQAELALGEPLAQEQVVVDATGEESAGKPVSGNSIENQA